MLNLNRSKLSCEATLNMIPAYKPGTRLDQAGSSSSTSELRTTGGSRATIPSGMERTRPQRGTRISPFSIRRIKRRRVGSGQSV